MAFYGIERKDGRVTAYLRWPDTAAGDEGAAEWAAGGAGRKLYNPPPDFQRPRFGSDVDLAPELAAAIEAACREDP